ncbi:MAG: hypothetical protein JWN46_1730 [Acidimicrobiales bacterium]|nr:hypothetical protein [Acidimicrobiales bacterium]
MNVVMLQGTLLRAPEMRVLKSGHQFVAYELRIERSDGPVDTVPVVWVDAPARALTLEAGASVVVTGRVRRRFFRAAGATASRTEVVATEVVLARQRKRVQAALERARAGMAAPTEPQP